MCQTFNDKDNVWSWQYTCEIFPDLLDAMWVTISATFVAYFVALILGLFLTLGRRSPIRPVKWFFQGFLEFVRGTPPLVQLFFIYFGFPEIPYIGFEMSAFTAGVLGLGIHYSTYVSEIYRSGIEAVPKSQWEASKALNFSKGQTWLRIVLPQAIPPVIPMLGNYLITMFKETPLLAAITLMEMLNMAKFIGAKYFDYLEPFTIVGFLFLLLSYPSAILVSKLEKRMNRRFRQKNA
nr:ectoine/hydroxyectoine ABC transporter permease subunit EhuD [Melghiribacillus thermohalophilus]